MSFEAGVRPSPEEYVAPTPKAVVDFFAPEIDKLLSLSGTLERTADEQGRRFAIITRTIKPSVFRGEDATVREDTLVVEVQDLSRAADYTLTRINEIGERGGIFGGRKNLQESANIFAAGISICDLIINKTIATQRSF
jgi:hypothetical protein